MALKPETEAHLTRAERNRAVARALCDPQHSMSLQPPPYDWAAIAAFYAAVHYVNAFLWERLGMAPQDHRARRQLVARTSPLNRAVAPYDRLTAIGRDARYTPTFSPFQPRVREAAYLHVDAIRMVVYQALGVSPP